MGLGILFALASLLIYRRLIYKEGMKVDFSASRRQDNDNGNVDVAHGVGSSELAHYSNTLAFD